MISGSHLTGTVTAAAGGSTTLWDHTVIGTVEVDGPADVRVVNGGVTVEHNIVHRTSNTVFANVTYGDASCCFPTAGYVATSMQNGSHAGETEKLTFGSVCGEAIGKNDSLVTARSMTGAVPFVGGGFGQWYGFVSLPLLGLGSGGAMSEIATDMSLGRRHGESQSSTSMGSTWPFASVAKPKMPRMRRGPIASPGSAALAR